MDLTAPSFFLTLNMCTFDTNGMSKSTMFNLVEYYFWQSLTSLGLLECNLSLNTTNCIDRQWRRRQLSGIECYMLSFGLGSQVGIIIIACVLIPSFRFVGHWGWALPVHSTAKHQQRHHHLPVECTYSRKASCLRLRARAWAPNWSATNDPCTTAVRFAATNNWRARNGWVFTAALTVLGCSLSFRCPFTASYACVLSVSCIIRETWRGINGRAWNLECFTAIRDQNVRCSAGVFFFCLRCNCMI